MSGGDGRGYAGPEYRLLNQKGMFDGIETLVICIIAMRFREGLKRAILAVHDWVENGGTLLTLYHCPSDDWDPDTLPLLRLETGQPSLRWRVTDKKPVASLLQPDHALLTLSNVTLQSDWDGWAKNAGSISRDPGTGLINRSSKWPIRGRMRTAVPCCVPTWVVDGTFIAH